MTCTCGGRTTSQTVATLAAPMVAAIFEIISLNCSG
jgi:hypothetical protein